MLKQQSHKLWPQLYSFSSTPITPQRDEQINDTVDSNMTDEEPYLLQVKKLKTDFTETNDSCTSYIYIKEVYDCQINFTETNLTATFHTK